MRVTIQGPVKVPCEHYVIEDAFENPGFDPIVCNHAELLYELETADLEELKVFYYDEHGVKHNVRVER